MSTSNTHNFNVTANDIITEALSLIGVLGIGESLDASESADALRTLNMMLKSGAWQGRNGIWLNEELFLFFGNEQIKYSIGPTGDHCSIGAAKTELSAAASSGASSVTIDATTGFSDTFDRDGIVEAVTVTGATLTIALDGALAVGGIATLSGQRKVLIYAAGDESGKAFAVVGQDSSGNAVTETITGPNAGTVYSTNTFKTITSVTANAATAGNIEVGQVGDHVGIELDDNTLHWTFIAAALSTTLSLVTALTDDAAIDNHVYSYTIKAPRPIEIVESRLHKAFDTDVPLITTGRLDYELLSDKASTGPVNQVFYDKQLINGEMLVWPSPVDMQEYLKFSAKIPIEDMTELTNDFAVAQEFFLPAAWNLAILLGPKHEKSIDAMMRDKADELLKEAMLTDTDDTPVFIQVSHQNTRSRGRW